jgi:hypothetical protein
MGEIYYISFFFVLSSAFLFFLSFFLLFFLYLKKIIQITLYFVAVCTIFVHLQKTHTLALRQRSKI